MTGTSSESPECAKFQCDLLDSVRTGDMRVFSGSRCKSLSFS
jgi:hypothetical protein